MLQEINKLPLHINWDEIIELQIKCLKNGTNGVGIQDLIITQNAKSNNCKIYSLNKHFGLISQVSKVQLF